MRFDVMQALRDTRSGASALSLEHRLYRLICLATGVLMLAVVVPVNLVEGTSLWLTLTVVTFGVLALVAYALVPRGTVYTRSFLLVLVTALNISWFTDGGIEGSIGYFFFAAVVYIGIFFRRAERTTYLVLFTLDGLTLLFLDYRYPALSIGFDSPLARTFDLMTGFAISTLGLTLMIWVVRSAFDGERRQQVKLNRQLGEALELNRQRTEELEATLAEVHTLRGLLPICSNCKSVRDDAGLWSQVEQYVSTHSDASFTHSLCPDCLRKLYPDYAESILAEFKQPSL